MGPQTAHLQVLALRPHLLVLLPSHVAAASADGSMEVSLEYMSADNRATGKANGSGPPAPGGRVAAVAVAVAATRAHHCLAA
jgi:hypothetical protein